MRFLSAITFCVPLTLFALFIVGGAGAATAEGSSGQASIRSDEFDSTTLDASVWRFVDPVGDATLTMNGSQAVISLPAGVSHDLWTGVNTVPRLLQDVPDQDFEVEVKLDSTMGSASQLQGIVVEQDADDLLRLEIHHDGSATRLFAGVIAGGVATSAHYSTVASGAPAYLRVRREGNQWTLSHSRDGIDWSSAASFTHAMTVASVGPFVGNSGGSAPAFEGKVDYFRVVSTTSAPPTDTTPPAISDATASPGSVAATVTWTTDEPAASGVAFGPSSAYEDGSVSSSTPTLTHRALLRGLDCGTVYHFQIRSVDEAGNEASTPDATFAAGACSESIRSDNFNSASLNTDIWTVVDPLGDAVVTTTGSQAEISLPAGVAHDVWVGIDTVARLLQPVPDADFEIEVKFDGPVTSAFQQQGLILEEDPNDLLRLEFHHDGGATRLFAASITGGSASVEHWSAVPGGAPKYLRLKRAGNQWTVRYSSAGATWTTAANFTHAMTVNALGPFAGNGGSIPPSFTSTVDYFREVLPDTTPPAVTGVSASPGTISATVAWTTDELATSRVAYGLTTDYEFGALSTTGTRTSHSLLLHGLRCGTTYHYQVRPVDLAGNAAAAPDGQLTTAPCPASLTSDEFDSATVDPTRWLWVDPLGDASVSTSGTQAVISVPAGTSHDLWTGVDEVPRLLQATPDDDFEAEVKFDSPVTTRYQMQGLLVQQDPRNLLRLEVHQEGGSAYLFLAGVTDGTASVIHQRAISVEAPVYLRLKRKGSKWTLRYSEDGENWISTTFNRAMEVGAVGPYAGNSGGSPPAFAAAIDYFRYIPPDRTPPQISGLSVTAGPIAAEVVWTTDEPATSTVAYGATAAYEHGNAEVAGERRNHRVVLHGLSCATTYHFQVRSADAEENVGSSADGTFTTGACPTELTSDEFDAASLNTDLWTFFDPLNDATATADGSHAAISVPAGVAHDVWTTSDTVPRLLQAAPDSNFEVEAKFDSQVAVRYQQQGIIVEQDAQNLVRFEIHSEGTETRLFVASIMGDTATIRYDRAVPNGASAYLRVDRKGVTWTARYSVDGETWPAVARFDQEFIPSAIGPHAGNGGSSPPAFAASVDYFRVVPPPPPDTTPPTLTSITALTHQVSATLTWSTNEISTTTVEWGQTAAYGQASTASSQRTAHRRRLTGLACGTTYHYRVSSTDAAGNEAVSADQTFTTAACTNGPSIAILGGNAQTFGTVGVPQRWVNILGNVEDPDGVGSLKYRLNGGQNQALNMGPTDDRLVYPGDFNVEIAHSDLLPGSNDVEITAIDAAGNSTVRHVQVDWQGNTGTDPPSSGPVLVVVAHPDDEALGMAGIIDKARSAGRKVYVAIVTNGDHGGGGNESGYCGAATGSDAATAAYGLRRNRETLAAMGLLGLQWSSNLASTDIIFLGYPDGKLRDVAAAGTPWDGDATGLHRTYAEDLDGSIATCNGDFRYLLDGHHSELYAGALAADLESLLDVTSPSDIYTHAGFDGNSDHAKVNSSLVAAIVRKSLNVRVHATLIHPEETEFCQPLSAAQWPNPALQNNDPFARFTPNLDVTAPPIPACEPDPTGTNWGPQGAPNELVEVPPAMQATTEATNLKWQVISRYETQINCAEEPGGSYHVNCGYMRAFVKKHEFFWTRTYSAPKQWPLPYSASWDSVSAITQHGQIIDGHWTHDGQGIRPVSTGFDRLVTLGDMGWTNYEVTAQITLNSFDQSNAIVGSGVGLALGWRGHSEWGQPRFGHPSGGICLYAWDFADPNFFKVQLGYSPGPANDTVLDKEFIDLSLGMPYTFRFRERDLGSGATRYSCKVWRSDAPEPSSWTVEADIPHWQGETGTHPGSVVLVAHNADATFGDVTITPVSG